MTEEESKPISTRDLSLHMAGTTSSKGEHRRRAFRMLLVPIIILSAVVVVVVPCGVGTIVHMYQQINSLQKQVIDSVHSCAQLNEDGTQASWQHLQQNVSMLYDRIHELDSVHIKISAIEFNVSQLSANSTNVQLINLAFALSELQHDLDSTTQDFLTTKSALEVNISQLNARANGTDMHLENLTANLDEVRDDLQQAISLLRAELFSRVSTIESQLDTYANGTDEQLRDLNSALTEMRYNLTSTRQDLLASKSAIDVLNARADSTDMELENLTATLGEARDDLQQAISLLRAELFSRVSTIESQLDTYANGTDEQLRDLNSALTEMRYNLTSTRQDLLASKSAIDVLNARANSTDMELENLTATLGEARDDLQQDISLLRAELFSRVSTIESQLDTYANRTDAQLRDFNSALTEMRYNLTSTRQDLLASKSAIDVLNARANSTDMELENLTATLGEAQDDLQQAISLLRVELFSRVSTIESQLDTYANGTDEQLRDLNSALTEMRYNLTSTRQDLLASKSAINVLNARANSTDMQLENLTATLGELHGDIDDNQHQLNHLSLMHDEHEQKIHQITQNMLRFHENVSLSQEIQVQEVSALQFNVSSLNSQISAIKHDVIQHDNLIQRFYNEQSRIDARVREIDARVMEIDARVREIEAKVREIEAKVNSASTTSPLSTASTSIVLLSTFFCIACVGV